jgi:hypothetical protein
VPVERIEPAIGKVPRDEDACHRADSTPVSLNDRGGSGHRDRSENGGWGADRVEG